MTDPISGLPDVPSADKDKDSKVSGESRQLNESGEICHYLSELDDVPDYTFKDDTALEPITILLEGLTDKQIMKAFYKDF